MTDSSKCIVMSDYLQEGTMKNFWSWLLVVQVSHPTFYFQVDNTVLNMNQVAVAMRLNRVDRISRFSMEVFQWKIV